MPTFAVILNLVLSAGVILGIVGLCASGIITDRPFASYLTNRAVARAERLSDRRRMADRRRVSREVAGYRGPRRRAVDVGA